MLLVGRRRSLEDAGVDGGCFWLVSSCSSGSEWRSTVRVNRRVREWDTEKIGILYLVVWLSFKLNEGCVNLCIFLTSHGDDI